MKSHMLTVCENRSYLKNGCILENLHSVLSVLHHQLWSQLHSTAQSQVFWEKSQKKPSTDKHLKKIHVCQVQDACLRCVSWCTAMSHPPGCMSALSPWRRKRMACRTRCATRHTRQAHKRSKRPSSLHLLFQVSQNVCDILHVVRNIDTR